MTALGESGRSAQICSAHASNPADTLSACSPNSTSKPC